MKKYTSYFDIISYIVKSIVFYYSFLILMVYNLPIFIMDNYICYYEYSLCSIITPLFNKLYKSPIYYILYIYILNYKLNNSLVTLLDEDSAPTHPYTTLLYATAYLSMVILNYICYLTIPLLSIIPNTISYGLNLSQIIYVFIDNKEYNYSNIIYFYNSNYVFFNSITFLYSIIEYTFLQYYNLELIGFFLLLTFSFPFLISYNYSKKIVDINLFLPFEIFIHKLCLLYVSFL